MSCDSFSTIYESCRYLSIGAKLYDDNKWKIALSVYFEYPLYLSVKMGMHSFLNPIHVRFSCPQATYLMSAYSNISFFRKITSPSGCYPFLGIVSVNFEINYLNIYSKKEVAKHFFIDLVYSEWFRGFFCIKNVSCKW